MDYFKTSSHTNPTKPVVDENIDKRWNDYRDIGPESGRIDRKFKPLGRLPAWFPKDSEGKHDMHIKAIANVRRANKYLAYMERRLWKLQESKDFEKLTLIWFILLKNSKVYQLSLFNYAYKGWYWRVKEEWAIEWLKECMNRCRKWNLRLYMKRFYLVKPGGTKYDRADSDKVKAGLLKIRPIGAPEIDSKMISRSMNNLIYMIKWDSFEDFQHGFRPGKGIHTVTFKLFEEIVDNGKTDIYEFDLKGFFNQVRIKWIYSILSRYSLLLAETIHNIVRDIHYNLGDDTMWDIEECDTELKIVGKKQLYKGVIPIIERSGLPQGLSISPVLCTMLMDVMKPPKDLFMMADDGIFLGLFQDFDFQVWSLRMAELGIPLVPAKSRQVEDGKFKFVGIDWDLDRRELSCKKTGRTWSWGAWDLMIEHSDEDNVKEIRDLRNESLKEWLLTVNQKYGNATEDRSWNWRVDAESMAKHFTERDFGIQEQASILKNSIYYNRVRLGVRWFPSTDQYHNISFLSSLCNAVMLRNMKEGLGLSPLASGSNFFGPPVLLKRETLDKSTYLEKIAGNDLLDVSYAETDRKFTGDYYYHSLEYKPLAQNWSEKMKSDVLRNWKESPYTGMTDKLEVFDEMATKEELYHTIVNNRNTIMISDTKKGKVMKDKGKNLILWKPLEIIPYLPGPVFEHAPVAPVGSTIIMQGDVTDEIEQDIRKKYIFYVKQHLKILELIHDYKKLGVGYPDISEPSFLEY